jgi:LacI family transcriptional regulator
LSSLFVVILLRGDLAQDKVVSRRLCYTYGVDFLDDVSDHPRPRATMRDVAALAGVALKTVSRVVNNESGVSDLLTERVRGAIRQLDFQPNIAASNLRRTDRRSKSIGLLVNDVANPFASALHRVIEDAAQRRGVVVLAGSIDEDQVRERQLASAFVARRVDGLILVPAGPDQSYLFTERRAGTPMVFVDRIAGLLDADAVLSAHAAGARSAIDHLIAHGHRRIGYLGHPISVTTAIDRFSGYTDALDRAGIELDISLVRHDLDNAEAATAALADLLALPEPPTAFFASQVFLTAGAIKALRQLDRYRDIGLVGFDDVTLADVLGVTIVRQDVKAIGSLAADVLFRRIDGDDSPCRHHIIGTQLVRRGSGEVAGPFR